jgi:hypothetical protein
VKKVTRVHLGFDLGQSGGQKVLRVADSVEVAGGHRCAPGSVNFSAGGPPTAGLAMGAEVEMARTVGTAGSTPRRHWPAVVVRARRGGDLLCFGATQCGGAREEQVASLTT